MFNKIKQKIKLAKLSAIIIWLLFILMIISNIYLNCKLIYIEEKIENINK